MPGAPGVNGPDAAVAVGGGPRVAGTTAWGALTNAGAPAQVASSGPKAVNVTVPVGVGRRPTPVTTAVSEMGLPSWAVGVAVVARPPVGTSTVTVVALIPSPVALVTVLRPDAYEIGDVWIPGASCESTVGSPRTSNVNSIVHVSRASPGGWSTTGPAASKTACG